METYKGDESGVEYVMRAISSSVCLETRKGVEFSGWIERNRVNKPIGIQYCGSLKELLDHRYF